MEDYEKLWKMGDGGQGKVYRVRQKATNREYAMKEIVCNDKQQLNFALKEIKVLMQLSHRHIVSYIDFFLDFEPRAASISVCLLMELCEGGDLQDKIKKAKREFMDTGKNAVDETMALELLRQCAEALQFIHERGFLHRDIKPTNIFHNSAGDVKLGDFGLAANVGFGRETTVGTPYYFAPECLLQQRYDAKVDIWGLGVVLYEVLTLRERPLNSEAIQDPNSIDAVIDTIMSMGYSRALAELVREMLRRHPGDRPSPAAILRRVAEIQSTKAGASQNAAGSRRGSSAGVMTDGEAQSGSAGAVASTQPPPSAVQVKVRPPPLQQVAAPAPRDGRHAPIPTPTSAAAGSSSDSRQPQPQPVGRGSHRMPTDVCTPVTQSPLDVPFPLGNATNRAAPIAKGAAKATGQPECTPMLPQPVASAAAAARALSNELTQGSGVVVVEVPRMAATIAEALAVPNVAKIIVAGGTRFTEPLVLSRGVQLIGLDPAPEIDVSANASAITIVGESGKIVNFVVTQSKAQRASGEKKPFAIEIVGGEWRIDRCVVKSLVGSGIGVVNDAADPIVTNCKIHQCKQAGLFVFDGAKGTFQGNEISECEYAGLLMKRAANPKLVENTIHHNVETGIFCHDSLGIIERNTLSDNKGCGIVVKGSNAAPTIRRNKISNNGQAGVFCCDSSEGIVCDNEILGNAKAGVLIKTAANPTIARNRINAGLETGVYVFEGGLGRIEDNEVSNHANAGVLVTTDGNPVVTKNRIVRNAYEGVWICKNGRGTFDGNDLRANGKGPKDLESATLVSWSNNREA